MSSPREHFQPSELDAPKIEAFPFLKGPEAI